MRNPSRTDTAPWPFLAFAEKHPEVADAYVQLGDAVRSAGPLDSRDVALVKLALSIGARLEGSVHIHAKKALAEGIEPAALEHVAILSCQTVGFPGMMMALGWIREVVESSGKS